MVTYWTVIKGEHFTDQNDICFKLQTELIKVEKSRKWENTDWSLFKEILGNEQITFRPIINEKRLKTTAKQLYTKLNYSPDQACQKTSVKIIDKDIPWWSQDLREKQKLLSKF